jgi:hypothetical protein
MSEFDRRGKSKNPNKMRNLSQYKDMSDEEFNKLMEVKQIEVQTSKQFENRIEDKLAKFEEDYDLTDLKINDREILRALVQSLISLEDYEQMLFQVRGAGVSPDNIVLIDKIQRVMSDLRKDISNFQSDLAITRKHRKSDQETSVIAYIDSLKEKARKFYKSKMNYVFCECGSLLGTVWALYPESNNKLTFVCQQKDKDGKECGKKTTVTTKELIENRNTNRKDIVPESLL